MKAFKIHSELQTLLPALSDAEYKGLEADILEHGCLSPLVTWGEYIVDGHNRYAICQDHELPFDTVELEFDSLDEAKFWAWSHQEHRRNLTPFQRAEIALQFKPMLAAKGKESQGKRHDLCPTLDKSSHDTKKELAQIAGVSHGTLNKAEYLDKHADEDTKQRLRNAETTINREYTRLRVAEENEVPDFDPEPLKPTFPNPTGTFQESVTLQHILLHKTESLITCLFSLFDAKYRALLIVDLFAKIEEEDGVEAAEHILSQIRG
jgi:hypothetical protein